MGRVKYFPSLEIAYSESGMCFRKENMTQIYRMKLTQSIENLDPPLMDANSKLLSTHPKPYLGLGRYKRLVTKLDYFTVTVPNISSTVNVTSQFVQSLCVGH